MKALIIEDEPHARTELKRLLGKVAPDVEVVAETDSVAETVLFLQSGKEFDLVFADIQLSDGLSFDIFSKVEVTQPVIFTTAYNEFAIKAFELNSIDYLLKPVDENELRAAFDKYKKLFFNKENGVQQIDSLLQALKLDSKIEYKERFLVKTGSRLISINVDEVAWFLASEKLVYLQMVSGNKYVIDYSLDELITLLNPKNFFQLNRQFISSIKSIKDIHTYFNGKLKISLNPMVEEEVLVSRERASEFKKWLDA
jgi:DNA-binding LytR/AlgR family response regulator